MAKVKDVVEQEAPLPSSLPLGLSTECPPVVIFPFVTPEVEIAEVAEDQPVIIPEPVEVCTEDYEAMNARGGYINLRNGFGPGLRVRVTPEEAMKVNHLRQQLKGEKLLDGTPIESNLDVFRYLLCQVE